MNWLEEAKRRYDELEQLEQQKQSRVIIKSEHDIPKSFVGIRVISIGLTSDEQAREILFAVLEEALELEEVQVFSTVSLSWTDVCRLDLQRIEKLTFTLNGMPGDEALNAPCLRRLCIFAQPHLTPVELMIHPTPHIDFSQMPNLERLELRHFQQIDPMDFKGECQLKHLCLTGADIINLDWLEMAPYRLESLCIDGSIEDCSGVIYQPSLKVLCLYNSFLKDASPIEQLSHLEKLDLLGADLSTEGNLRAKGIRDFVITKRDQDIKRIRQQVTDLGSMSVHNLWLKNKQLDRVNELPAFKRKMLLKTINLPFEERMMRLVKYEFEVKLKQIVEDKRMTGLYTMSREEYRDYFISMAKEFYPFLVNSC